MNTHTLQAELQAAGVHVALTDKGTLLLSPKDKLTPDIITKVKEHKPALVCELARERRRSRVLALLNQPGDHRYAFLTDDTSDPAHIIVTVGIRSVATFELLVPRDRWNPILFLQYLEGIDRAVH